MNALAISLSTIMLFLAVPVFLVFGLGSALVAIWGLNLPWSTLIQVAFGAVTKPVLIAMPLFIFTGMVMLKGGAASRLVAFSIALVGHLPGGLGMAMVVTMGLFATFCSSILAAIIAIGSIMMPRMIEEGYPKPFVIVLAASAALLESLIPPSNAAILFSALTNVPVPRTFAAGIIPGLILLAFMVAVVIWKCRHIQNTKRVTGRERLLALKHAAPGLITPVIISAGIYTGVLTPSEAAAVACVWAILIGFFIYRELTLSALIDCLHETVKITAVILAIIAMATFLSTVLTYSKAPQAFITQFNNLGGTPMMFWFAVAAICLILGMFVEIVPAFYLTMPIFAAIAFSQKLDILHLYVVFVAFAGIGMITPPVCVSIQMAAGILRVRPKTAFREVPLFVLVSILFGILIVLFPAAATWLPALLT